MRHYIIILTLSALAFSSCDKFLEEHPRDSVPEDEAYVTGDQLYLNAVASLYSCVGGHTDSYGLQGTRRGVYDLNTFTTDEAIIPTRGADWYDGGLWQDLYTHHWGTGHGAVGDTWTYLFQTILRCNHSLKVIREYNERTGANMIDYYSEVRALRALFYFYAMDLYGRVPVFTSAEPTAAELKPQPRSVVFRFIRDELQHTMPLLSDAHSNQPGAWYSHITKPVAMFLLAKLALNGEVYNWDDWTGSARPDGKNIKWTVNGGTMNTWEAAAYYCNEITKCGYDLEPYFPTNFQVDNEKSVENIFVIPMDKYLYTNQFTTLFRSRHYNHASALGLNGENGSCATIEALKAFGYETAAQDPRFDITYYAGKVYDYAGEEVLLDDGTPLVYMPWAVALDISGTKYEKTAGARMRKYDVDPTATKDGNQSNNDIVLFRYADVLLMQAEALLRNQGENSESTTLVNKVRARVGAQPLAVATLELILRERLLELAWEGWRRNDMIRFDTFTLPRSSAEETAFESDHHTIVFPLPGEFLLLCGGEQNKGY